MYSNCPNRYLAAQISTLIRDPDETTMIFFIDRGFINVNYVPVGSGYDNIDALYQICFLGSTFFYNFYLYLLARR
jgi:hypothetical protein